MKFTEEQLEKAFTMVNGQLLMVNEAVERMSRFLYYKLHHFKMSSFFANKLDKYITFVLPYKG